MIEVVPGEKNSNHSMLILKVVVLGVEIAKAHLAELEAPLLVREWCSVHHRGL